MCTLPKAVRRTTTISYMQNFYIFLSIGAERIPSRRRRHTPEGTHAIYANLTSTTKRCSKTLENAYVGRLSRATSTMFWSVTHYRSITKSCLSKRLCKLPSRLNNESCA
uniref:Uncharacterized protein n=1 Tax=Ixodes ricinus TaxID=34613 RepID=A0A131Y5H9_IXORI